MSIGSIVALQKSRMNVYGSTFNDLIQDTIFNDFEENPAFRVVRLNGENVKIHAIDSNIKAGIVERFVIPKPPFEFKIGDTYLDDKDVHWMCININDFHYNKCLFLPCNDTLTYQNPTTLEITKIPCVLTDKSSVYNDGLKTGTIILQDDQIAIKVPFDKEIAKFTLKKRFIFQHSVVYELTQVDPLTEKGLIKLTMKRTQESSLHDNFELNIADYIEHTIEPELPAPTEIVISGSNLITLNQTNTYTVDSVGSILFSLKDDSGVTNTNLATITEQSNNTCKVKASGVSSNVGKYFRLYASDGVNESYIRIMVKSLF